MSEQAQQADKAAPDAERIETIDELIDEFSVAMLVTRSLDGEFRARPMVVAGHDEGSVLYFLTRSDDEKLDELLRDPRINVVMQSDGKYLSVSGEARIETGQIPVEDYWSPSARLWFPDGPDDAAVALIVVEPTYAEAWDRTGLQRLEFLWEAGKALLTRTKAKDDELSGHKKVELD